MKNKIWYISLLILCICCSKSPDRMSRISVIRVWDGDTYDAKMADGKLIRVRLAYIDCPEIQQSFGLAANYILDSLIGKKQVLFYFLENDKYGRKVGITYDANTRLNINEFMVKRGMAHVYPQYAPKELYKEMLVAKNNKKGLWQNPYPIEPYIFRKQSKTK